jgi:uncharacterized membrane-anchored protein YitT (DUF2179 family)
MKQNSQINNYLCIIIGTFSLAIGTVLFLSPNQVLTGGGIGIALLNHTVTNSLTLGTLLAFVSIPFITLGYIYFGKAYTFKTFIAMILTAFFTDFLKEYLQLKPLTNDILLASIFGGIFIGIGVGLVIKGRSSTGSTSVLGEIIAMKTNLKAAEVLLIIDAGIMITSMFVYDNMNQSLYSILGVYITSKVIDLILTGRPSKKIINIVSNNAHELKLHIRDKIEEHGTILVGEGLHQGQLKTVIFVAVDVTKIQLLKDLLKEYDPEAFMIITEATELLGRD